MFIRRKVPKRNTLSTCEYTILASGGVSGGLATKWSKIIPKYHLIFVTQYVVARLRFKRYVMCIHALLFQP